VQIGGAGLNVRGIKYFRKTSPAIRLNFFQKIRNAFTRNRSPKTVPQHRFSNTLNLEQEQPYRVIKEFKDYDKEVHPAGETWIYIGTAFLPYEDGLSLFVKKDDVQIMYRLQWRKEEQADIIDNFKDYVERC